jgi:hypothetical protein
METAAQKTEANATNRTNGLAEDELTAYVLRQITKSALLYAISLQGGGEVVTGDVARYLATRDLPLLEMSMSTSDVREVREGWLDVSRMGAAQRERLIGCAASALARAGNWLVNEEKAVPFCFLLYPANPTKGDGSFVAEAVMTM